MKPEYRRCLLRRIACQPGARSVEMTLPISLAKAGSVVEIDCDLYLVASVYHPAPEHRSVIRPEVARPCVKQEVIDYLLSQA